MTVGFAFDARLELDDLGSILTRRGLTPGGRVQTAVDEAVLRYCAPKVPFDTGYLIRSALQASAIGEGLIVYATPTPATSTTARSTARTFRSLRAGSWPVSARPRARKSTPPAAR